MKSTLFFRTALAAVLLLGAITATAHDFAVDGIYYKVNNDCTTTVIVTYKGASAGFSDEYSGSVTIPASVTYSGKTYSVTSIGDYAFYGCSGLTSVNIPSSVTSIGNAAFKYSGLTAVSIGNSVTSIGEYAFQDCSSLTAVKLPNSVTSIGKYAFHGCSAMKKLSIGNSIKNIREGTFSGCGLTSLTIPLNVTNIDSYAFASCKKLKSLTISSSTESITNTAFSGCSELNTIKVNSGNKKYDSRDNCNAIIITATNTLHTGCKSTLIPNSVTSIGNYAFNDCSGLTAVEIPNSVTTIGKYAFSLCSGLTAVEISNSVTSIGDYAFNGCSGLTAVSIGNSVTSIGEYAFYDCSGLNTIKVQSGNQTYDSRDNCNAIIETATNTLLTGCKSTLIPNSVTSIGDYAFERCSGLTAVEIPNSVTTIGKYAFNCCSGLTAVSIGNSVTTIGKYAFNCCSGLTAVSIGNSVTSIGGYAFANCKNLEMVFYNAKNFTGATNFDTYKKITFVIGAEVEQIGDYILNTYYSGDTKKIVSHATTPPVITSKTFSTTSCPLYVPKDSYAKYWTADVWSEFTNIRPIENPVTNIELNKSTLNLATNRTAKLTTTISPSNATLKEVYWSSDAPDVASVDQTGNIAGLQSGTATITAMAIDGSGVKATCLISVEYINAEVLTLNPSELTIEINQSAKITPVTTPEIISSTFEWSTSDANVASFYANSDGTITVIGAADGVATITCRAIDGSNLTATCVVTVGFGNPILALNPSELTLEIFHSARITPVIMPENVSCTSFEWSTSNADVAPYKANSDGTITVLGAADGVATITCRTTDGSNLTATCTVTVGTGAVEGIEADAVKVRGENGVIRIDGAEDAKVEVYNAAGVCIYSGTATEIPVPQRGLYVVKVAGRATKIAL